MTTDERIERLADWLMACRGNGGLVRAAIVNVLKEFVDDVTANEQHDVGMFCRHLTRVYEHFAGLSKPNTDPEEVIRIAEERRRRDVDAILDEALEQAAEMALHKPRLAFLPVSTDRQARRELLREYGRRVAEEIRSLKSGENK